MKDNYDFSNAIKNPYAEKLKDGFSITIHYDSFDELEVTNMPEYHISMTWDSEAEVWCAVCDDIPMALDSESFDTLVERVKIATPELLALNGKSQECILNFVSAYKVKVS